MYRKSLEKFSPRRKWVDPVAHITLPILAIVSLSFSLAGCGAGTGGASKVPPPNSEETVSIPAPPVSQIVPIDRPAKFSAIAVGALPLHYQWYENGAAIPGATGTSYTLPNVSASDTGLSFKVKVTNVYGSLTSKSAVLTAGPRAPKIGDLRYLLWQQITLPGLKNSPAHAGEVFAGTSETPNAVGTPLMLGPGSVLCPTDCAWEFSVISLPPPMTGLTMWYRAGNYPNLDKRLQSFGSNVVITSLAMEPKYDTYGISWIESSKFSGFEYRMQVVPPSAIQATAALDGANGRVVTAVSFGAQGNAHLISYGWTGDQTTYDVKTMTVASGSILSAAKQLGADGYIISAFGGANSSGWVLVGMHAMGYSQPRSMFTSSISDATLPPDTAYFTPVVWFSSSATGLIGINEQ